MGGDPKNELLRRESFEEIQFLFYAIIILICTIKACRIGVMTEHPGNNMAPTFRVQVEDQKKHVFTVNGNRNIMYLFIILPMNLFAHQRSRHSDANA